MLHSKKPIVSVIVPIYNVEQYLEKCVNSLLHQTLENLEIILVDDGSTDSSGQICDKFKALDNRIYVIHKENGGLSDARNCGLNIAGGKYIGFVDSDDYVALSFYEVLVKCMEENNCDLVECGVNLVKDNKVYKFRPSCTEILSGKEAVERYLTTNKKNVLPRVAVWSKLYKSEFWKNNRFPTGHIHEDYFLTCKAIYESKKIGLIKKGLYYHIISNANSITHAKFSSKDLYLHTQFQKRIAYFRECKEKELELIAQKQYWILILSLAWRCHINGLNPVEEYVNILAKNKREILKSKIGFKRKIDFVCYYISPVFYFYIRKKISRFH